MVPGNRAYAPCRTDKESTRLIGSEHITANRISRYAGTMLSTLGHPIQDISLLQQICSPQLGAT